MNAWIVDSHAHLDMQAFDADRDSVIERARIAGLAGVITIATGDPRTDSVRNTLSLAEKHELIYAGIGVHPHDASWASEEYLERMQAWAGHPKVVLWGEIGLDYHYDNSPRDIQRRVFRQQLGIARRLGLPVSIHCREAWDEVLAILRQDWPAKGPSGIFHSFTGSAEQGLQCCELGFFISVSGILTFKSASKLREAAAVIPLDRLLVETDCPYLAPVPHRGKRNEPANVVDVARCLAEIRDLELEEIGRLTTSNLGNVLGIDLLSASK